MKLSQLKERKKRQMNLTETGINVITKKQNLRWSKVLNTN